MPVYILECPKCNYQFKGFIMTGTLAPKEWACSQCGSRKARPVRQLLETHPLETQHGKGCPCCG